MKCKSCNGAGTIQCPKCNGEGFSFGHNKCMDCNGEGFVPCEECQGDGKVKFMQWLKSS